MGQNITWDKYITWDKHVSTTTEKDRPAHIHVLPPYVGPRHCVTFQASAGVWRWLGEGQEGGGRGDFGEEGRQIAGP